MSAQMEHLPILLFILRELIIQKLSSAINYVTVNNRSQCECNLKFGLVLLGYLQT